MRRTSRSITPSTSALLPTAGTVSAGPGRGGGRGRRRGFTIGEIAVVIGIIGVLAAIAIPTFLGQRVGAEDAAAISDLRSVVTSAVSSKNTEAEAAGFVFDAGHEDGPGAGMRDILAAIEPGMTFTTHPVSVGDGTTLSVWVDPCDDGIAWGEEGNNTACGPDPADEDGATTFGVGYLYLTRVSDSGTAYIAQVRADGTVYWGMATGGGPYGGNAGSSYIGLDWTNEPDEGDAVPTEPAPLPPPDVPSAPIGLTAVPGDSAVELSWEAPEDEGASPVTTYVVEISVDGGQSFEPVTDGLEVLTYEINELENGTEYTIRVAAVSDEGVGEWAVTGTVTPFEWDQFLDFSEDGAVRPHEGGNGWVIGGEWAAQNTSIVGGKLRMFDNANGVNSHFTKNGVVSGPMTLDIVMRIDPTLGFTPSGEGLELADGANLYRVDLSSYSATDPVTGAIYLVDLTDHDAHLRLVKTAGGAELYVDGVKAFDVGATATGSNYVWFGTTGSTGWSTVLVSSVGLASVPLNEAGMSTHSDIWAVDRDFSDGALPNVRGWVLGGNWANGTISGEYLRIQSEASHHATHYTIPDAVGEELTFDTMFRTPPWAQNSAHVHHGARAGSVEIADGANTYRADFFPTYVQDQGSGAKYYTNFTAEDVHIRVVKAGGVLTVYVGGEEAVQLTATGAAASNYLRFGAISGPGEGRSLYDHLRVSGQALAPDDMDEADQQWLAEMPYANNVAPQGFGFILSGAWSNQSNRTSIEGEKLRLRNPDSNNQVLLTMSGVVTTSFTFETKIRVVSNTGNTLAVVLDDGTSSVRVNLGTAAITDPISGESHAVDMTVERTLRIIKDGTGAAVLIDGVLTPLALQNGASVANGIRFGSQLVNGNGVSESFWDDTRFAQAQIYG